jgi:hypothetical protein
MSGTAHEVVSPSKAGESDLEKPSDQLQETTQAQLETQLTTLRAVAEVEPNETPGLENTFALERETCSITFRGEECVLRRVLGLDYISVLLRYPGRAISAADMQAQGADVPIDSPNKREELLSEFSSDDESNSSTPSQTFGSDDVIDPTARVAYEKRLKEIPVAIVMAEAAADERKIESLRKEEEFILSELRKSTNRQGRTRRFANRKEQARSAVRHAIRLAFKKIEKFAPETARYLSANIETGADLIYKDEAVRWKF